jgi:hypothetical protein
MMRSTAYSAELAGIELMSGDGFNSIDIPVIECDAL